ncbi:GTP-binding protein [Beggiatoa leptomitoformis]|uniref:GTP-binding protein n=1 Tax=Beggiatoa leptomitoformis TaxID=288004 RepID=A0A2N9YDN3_9GAMM|nr:ATP/GTP-binding protein [Beggiatoa leptomitoformis]ALG69111.1 GTP-binding protein [Beggiatoa leptomitoformis]AUI68475.1 GTP-binding protein [Beggiatoa leptomitoformis]
MSNYKLIFTGPSGAGKSTAIAALSDIPVVTTEAKARERNEGHRYKETITVALDYGVIRLPNQDKIHLYGTPGQERFNFMWDILTEGGLGLIILIDNARANPLDDLAFFVEKFADFIQKTRVAIGITRMDVHTKPRIADYHERLKKFNIKPPLFDVDARSKRDVSLLIQALMFSLDPCLRIQE